MRHTTNDSAARPPRREFLKSAGAMAAGLCLAAGEPLAASQEPAAGPKTEPLALYGGTPAVDVPRKAAGSVPLAAIRPS